MYEGALSLLIMRLVSEGYEVKFKRGHNEGNIIFTLAMGMLNLDFSVERDEIMKMLLTTPDEAMVFVLERMRTKFINAGIEDGIS